MATSALFIAVDLIQALLEICEVRTNAQNVLKLLHDRRASREQLRRANSDLENAGLIKIILGITNNLSVLFVKPLQGVRLWACLPHTLESGQREQLYAWESSGLFGPMQEHFVRKPSRIFWKPSRRRIQVAPAHNQGDLSAKFEKAQDKNTSPRLTASTERSKKLVVQGLQLLFHCEYLVLVEYVEAIIPLHRQLGSQRRSEHFDILGAGARIVSVYRDISEAHVCILPVVPACVRAGDTDLPDPREYLAYLAQSDATRSRPLRDSGSIWWQPVLEECIKSEHSAVLSLHFLVHGAKRGAPDGQSSVHQSTPGASHRSDYCTPVLKNCRETLHDLGYERLEGLHPQYRDFFSRLPQRCIYLAVLRVDIHLDNVHFGRPPASPAGVQRGPCEDKNYLQDRRAPQQHLKRRFSTSMNCRKQPANTNSPQIFWKFGRRQIIVAPDPLEEAPDATNSNRRLCIYRQVEDDRGAGSTTAANIWFWLSSWMRYPS
ncbi:hypothetical protein ON010_g7511 [Phytophthora cinnamomi]|nr:hypothetical protein ON010_g7511 [Phytophthora cinnamomi]